ncbi:DUF6000 family protein [Kitasatospora sp. NPDC101176]|uniref:DUF6000 family protein n=1 Tax=Kitasatospora sp. NPDC101176 TaxID=3364099 RepID=UPI003803155E
MRDTFDDPETRDFLKRYAVPGRWQLRLGPSLFRRDDAERDRTAQQLARAAGEVTPRVLDVLLEGGWRDRKVATWLIVVSGRTEYRERIGELLLASEGPYVGASYCAALAVFATEADAALLVAYLERYLRRPDLSYDQLFAMVALLHLDGESGRDDALRFLAPGGLWEQWCAARAAERGTRTPDPQACLPAVEQLCAFARSTARLMDEPSHR